VDGKNRNQIAVHLKNEQILTPTFYLKQQDRGTAKSRTLNENNRFNWNKATLTHILTRQEYCGDIVNFKTTKHYRDKRNHYVDKSEWHITKMCMSRLLTAPLLKMCREYSKTRLLKDPTVTDIHPLSGLLFCKDCGSKMRIRIDHRNNNGKRHVEKHREYDRMKAREYRARKKEQAAI